MNERPAANRPRTDVASAVERKYLNRDEQGDSPVVIGSLTPTIDDRDDPRMRRSQFRLVQSVASPAPVTIVPAPGGAVLSAPQYPAYSSLVNPQPAPYAAPVMRPGYGQPYAGPSLGAPYPGYCWTGFYVGGHGGYGWSNFNPVIGPSGATAVADFHTFTLNHSANGPLFGGHAGYNLELRSWVLGVEADFDAAGLSGSQTTTFPSLLVGPPGAVNGAMVSDKIDWLASARGRVGFAPGRNLFYFTGGVAWENIRQDSLVNAQVAPGVFGVSAPGNLNATRLGYVVGGGYERMIAEHWTIRGEYLYYAFDHTNVSVAPFSLSATPSNAAIISTPGNHIHVVRLGVSYKF